MCPQGVGLFQHYLHQWLEPLWLFWESEDLKFIEVYAKCSVETCIKRDPKGLYKKALEGKIKDMTGIQDSYEEPLNPEITIDTEKETLENCVDQLIKKLNHLT